MEEAELLRQLRENEEDPLLHAIYAHKIKDNLALKKLHYLRAIQLYPFNPDWHLKYVNICISMGQERAGYVHIGEYNKRIRGFNNLILIKAANYHFHHRNYEIANALYLKINNNMIWRKKLNLKIGITYKYLKQYDLATKYLKRHLRQQGEDKKRIITLMFLAKVYFHRKKYKKSLEIYTEKLSTSDIKRNELYTDIGLCYFKMHDFEKALSYFDKIKENQCKNALNRSINLLYKGIIYSRQCQMYQIAIKCFESIDVNYRNGSCRLHYDGVSLTHSIDNEMAFCYFYLEQFDKSLKYYQVFINDIKYNTKHNKHSDYRYQAFMKMAIIHTKQGNHREAFELYKNLYSKIHKTASIKKIKASLAFSYHFANCCMNLGQFKLALKHYLMQSNCDKKKHAAIYVSTLKQIAFIYHHKLGKYNKAIKFYDRLMKMGDIDKDKLCLQYANCLQITLKYETAFKMFESYLNLHPDSIYCINKLVTLNMIGRLNRDKYCQKLIEKSMSLDSNSLHTNYIYAFHLKLIQNDDRLSQHHLFLSQSLWSDNQHRTSCISKEICIDIGKLYCLIDNTSDSFEDIGLRHFPIILKTFPDCFDLFISYGQFLCKFNRFQLLDTFHDGFTKYGNSFYCNNKYICLRIREYGFKLYPIGRIDFAIQLLKTAKNRNSFLLKSLGILYQIKRDYDSSELCLKRSLEIDTMDFEANMTYANLLYQMHRFMEASLFYGIAFCENSKHKKNVKRKDLINYCSTMCHLKHYELCIQGLVKVDQSTHLKQYTQLHHVLIHRLIVEIYCKMGYKWDHDIAIKHLQIINQEKANKDDNNVSNCILI